MERIRVGVHARDPITLAGATMLLRGSDAMTIVAPERLSEADVLVLAHDELVSEDLRYLRERAHTSSTPIVLVVREVREAQLLTVVECGVMAIVPRSQAIGDKLARTVVSVARGAGEIPTGMVGPLLNQVRRLHHEVLRPNGFSASGLSDREIEVLKLLADGCDTAEVGKALWYSERTVKNIIQGVLARMNLRNRTQAVAYAVRVGVV